MTNDPKADSNRLGDQHNASGGFKRGRTGARALLTRLTSGVGQYDLVFEPLCTNAQYYVDF